MHREAPGAIVGENRRAVAFLTLGPLRPGHTLVVPRVHATNLDDISPGDWAGVARLGLEVGRRQRDRLGADGITLFLASGEAGEQSVFHLHLHVVPRSKGDALDLNSWWGSRARSAVPSELDVVAAKLRGAPGRTSSGKALARGPKR